MKFSALQIGQLLGGEVVGNPLAEVSKLAKIEEGEAGALTFLANPKYAQYVYSTQASVAIVNKSFVAEHPLPESLTLIKVPDAYTAFAQLLDIYSQLRRNKKGIDPHTCISPSTQVHDDVYIGPFTSIGDDCVIGKNVKIYANCSIGDNVKIGDNTILFAGVKLYEDTVIGSGCILHAGCVIGADGFGFAPSMDNVYKKVAQIGNVIINDNVDVGANTCIDRATMGSTVIGAGVKLDNFIQVAHNVSIGENTVIASQVGIAGSTKIGRDCMIGGQVGIAGHLSIGDRVKIAAKSGVQNNISDDETVRGIPAYNSLDYNRSYAHYKKLPSLEKRIKELEKALIDIKQTL